MKLWGKEQRSECLGDGSPCWVCWNSWLGSLQTPPCLLKVVRIIIGRKRISLLCLHFKGKWPLSPARTPKIFSSLHGLAFWLAGCCCVSIPGAGLSGGSQRPKAFVQLLSCFTFPDRENGCGLACMPGEEAQNDRAPWLPGKLGAHDSIQPANTGLALFMFFFSPWGEMNQFKVYTPMMLSSFTVLCNCHPVWFQDIVVMPQGRLCTHWSCHLYWLLCIALGGSNLSPGIQTVWLSWNHTIYDLLCLASFLA